VYRFDASNNKSDVTQGNGCYSNLIELSVILDEVLERDLFGNRNTIDFAIALNRNLPALHRDTESSHVAQVNR
jgi:hypothetical protein